MSNGTADGAQAVTTPSKGRTMRRLLALPLIAGAAFAVSTPAAQADDCYLFTSPRVTVGACAGIRCNDICAPEVYAYPVCSIDLVIVAECVGGIH